MHNYLGKLFLKKRGEMPVSHDSVKLEENEGFATVIYNDFLKIPEPAELTYDKWCFVVFFQSPCKLLFKGLCNRVLKVSFISKLPWGDRVTAKVIRKTYECNTNRLKCGTHMSSSRPLY